MTTLSTLILAAAEGAAEHEEESKTAFYVLGGILAGWAVVLSAIGMTSPSFPGGAGGQRAVMGITAILMLAAVVAAAMTG
jgi:hypothetical protein